MGIDREETRAQVEIDGDDALTDGVLGLMAIVG
jgi:hypothetical protein